MRIFKLAIISFIFLAIFFTVISFFLPSDIRISKGIELNVSKEQVMNQLLDPANWRNWYPGLKEAQLFYADSVVKGVIVNKERGQRIAITGQTGDEVMIRYFVTDKKEMAGGWKVTTGENAVMLQWYMSFRVRWYPWEKFAGLLYERSFGDQMKTGLTRLKDMLESK